MLMEHGKINNRKTQPGMVVTPLNANTLEQREVNLCEFKANLVDMVSSRSARTP